jgi:AcrR family transcriptional regulator
VWSCACSRSSSGGCFCLDRRCRTDSAEIFSTSSSSRALTRRDLMAASGTNLGSIGYHFGSREALLNQALEELCTGWTELLASGGSVPDGARGHPKRERTCRGSPLQRLPPRSKRLRISPGRTLHLVGPPATARALSEKGTCER